jgi:single-strand DNA-binding protein
MARKSTTTASAPEVQAPAPAPLEQGDEPLVTLTGRLCADPVLRSTKSGIPVSTIRIAVNPPEGEATFHNVVVWKATAQAVCKYLKKGRKVEVIGRPQERTWTDKDGNERTTAEISAFRVEFLSREQRVSAAPAAEEVAA